MKRIGNKITLKLLVVPLLFLMLTVGANAAPAEAHDGGYFHTVASGETLSQIASWYGVNMYDIMMYNAGIYNPNYILAGSVLYIPTYHYHDSFQGGGSHIGYYCSYHYHVAFGDTLSGIAQWFGRSMEEIAGANQIYWYDWIYAGQVLCIP